MDFVKFQFERIALLVNKIYVDSDMGCSSKRGVAFYGGTERGGASLQEKVSRLLSVPIKSNAERYLFVRANHFNKHILRNVDRSHLLHFLFPLLLFLAQFHFARNVASVQISRNILF